MMQEISTFLNNYPIIAIAGALVAIVLIINLAKSAIQATIGLAVVALAYTVYLLATGESPPDVDRVLHDGRVVVDAIREEGKEKLAETVSEQAREIVEESVRQSD